MKLSKKHFIRLGIVLLLIIPLISLKFYTYYVEEKATIFSGKVLTFQIREDEVFDYSMIDNDYRPSLFGVWDTSEREKLIEYMKENNLVIKPGRYKFHQGDRFVKVKRIFQFEKKKD